MPSPSSIRRSLVLLAVSAPLMACASAGGGFPQPTAVRIPVPIEGNTGKFMSPYTSDGTIAPWVRKARTAQAGAAIGGYAGRKAGEKALGSVPFVGGRLGKKAGEVAGRAAALSLVGGEDALREGSDLSFNTAAELAVYLYAFQPGDPEEKALKDKVVKFTYQIYPDVQNSWMKAIQSAKLAKGESQVLQAGMER